MKLNNLQWFVLNPLGQTMREVIVAGPFEAEWDAEATLGDPDVYHLALMDADRVRRSLDEEARLNRALAPWTPPDERPTRVSVSANGTRRVTA